MSRSAMTVQEGGCAADSTNQTCWSGLDSLKASLKVTGQGQLEPETSVMECTCGTFVATSILISMFLY